MSYKYELVVYTHMQDVTYGLVGKKLKRFIGNDKNELQERFEMWFIKQGLMRENIDIYLGEIQHAGYVAK